MSESSTIFALDLGTTKFCLARYCPNQAIKVELVSVPAKGMERGMLANLQQAKLALCELIEKAEQQFDEDVLEVSVGIAGSHLSCKHETLTAPLSTQRVRGIDIDQMTQLAQSKFLDNDREVLHLIPIQYELDGRVFNEEPIDFSGKNLSIRFLKIDGNQHYLQDVLAVCNQSGLRVRRFIAEPVASASVTLSEEQKKNGVLLLDIGGGTSDGLIFLHNKPWHSFTINIAGKMMTQDLCIGLGLDWDNAEKVKHKIGLLINDPQANILVTNNNQKIVRIYWNDVYPILGARIKELALKLNEESRLYVSQTGCGIMLTGGGAGVLGLERVLEKITYQRANKCFPVFHSEQSKQEFAPAYATVIGLINMDVGELVQNKMNPKKLKVSRYLTHFMNWLKELS